MDKAQEKVLDALLSIYRKDDDGMRQPTMILMTSRDIRGNLSDMVNVDVDEITNEMLHRGYELTNDAGKPCWKMYFDNEALMD